MKGITLFERFLKGCVIKTSEFKKIKYKTIEGFAFIHVFLLLICFRVHFLCLYSIALLNFLLYFIFSKELHFHQLQLWRQYFSPLTYLITSYWINSSTQIMKMLFVFLYFQRNSLIFPFILHVPTFLFLFLVWRKFVYFFVMFVPR